MKKTGLPILAAAILAAAVGCGKQNPDIVNENAVDMGIRINGRAVLWAKANLGASGPDDPGAFYAWGETASKQDYSWENYEWMNMGEGSAPSRLTKYNVYPEFGTVDNLVVLEFGDDVAARQLGGLWRMPGADEWAALWKNCDVRWNDGGATPEGYSGKGLVMVSKINGNSLFLPAAGYMEAEEKMYDGSEGRAMRGYYWSSSLSLDEPHYAGCLVFGEGVEVENGIGINFRCTGLLIRPVWAY